MQILLTIRIENRNNGKPCRAIIFGMARQCKTCAHPEIKEIDKALLAKHSNTEIAKKYGLNHQSVNYHAKVHLKPILDKANKAAERAITRKVLKYREEVNYPLLDKLKLLQERILDDMDVAALDERVPLFREFRGSLQEEAKLAGAYQQDRKNESDVDRVVEAYRLWEQWYGSPDAAAQQNWIGWLSLKSGIGVAEITQKIKVQEITEKIQ